MTNETAVTQNPALGEFVIDRTFDAPRALVWKALTEPERMKDWWGPKGFAVRVANLDLRPGGSYHYCMASPEGHEMWGKFAYREVVPNERLVFINSFSDAEGNITPHPMNATWPREMLSTFTLGETDGKTTLTIHWTPYHPTEQEMATFEAGHESMQKGWGGTLDKLTEYLAGH